MAETFGEQTEEDVRIPVAERAELVRFPSPVRRALCPNRQR